MNCESWLRTKELAHRSRHRLGVDQIARHRRLHFLMDRHLLLDRALHALETDAELVFEQLAHRAHAAVAEVIDVVLPEYSDGFLASSSAA